ncbi:methylmalonyl-CoA mutase family protein [Polyangium sorediatum]|uniref:Methylmalonyl-CoA mutase family protein n=1 Tax=Polyangium sorediatum TaxID=889274 RepID=A0ABT6NZR9_9BACT|nr:methylmalonyl-CoA mutase family protein [Polyangium sorediatum]MDI1433813.1 methylmalonyl-CoA mutase family protein [Polyangium sorediatum]
MYPPRPSIRLISDIFAFCSKDVPYWNTISISGYRQTAGMTLLAQQPMVNVVRVAMQALAAVLGGCQSVTDFVDPLGGSYVVEALTTRLEQAAREYIRRVDDLGGMVSAIEQGYVQREIQAAAYRYQLEIEEKKRVIVGLNEFTSESPPVTVVKIDPRIEREQAERTRAWRAEHTEILTI